MQPNESIGVCMNVCVGVIYIYISQKIILGRSENSSLEK